MSTGAVRAADNSNRCALQRCTRRDGCRRHRMRLTTQLDKREMLTSPNMAEGRSFTRWPRWSTLMANLDATDTESVTIVIVA